MQNELKLKEILRTEECVAGEFLLPFVYPWEVIPKIGEIIYKLTEKHKDDSRFYFKEEGILVAKSAKIANSAELFPPLFIDEEAEIRPFSFIRGNAIIGKGAVVGNSSEIKNSILFNRAAAPHFNYVGDSLLGFRAHMGAGAVTSNLKMDKSNITIKYGEEKLETGLRKFGAILGDFCEVGCGCVLNPGTVVGKCTSIYPLTSTRGFIPAYSVVKDAKTVIKKEER